MKAIVELRISKIRASGRESHTTSIIRLDELHLYTATPPRGDFEATGFERPISEKFSGHFERMLKWVSTITKISHCSNSFNEYSERNLLRTPLMFQKHNLTERLKSTRLDFSEKTGSGQLHRCSTPAYP